MTSPDKLPYYHTTPEAQDLIRRYNSGERHFQDLDIPECSDLSNTNFAGAYWQGHKLTDQDGPDEQGRF